MFMANSALMRTQEPPFEQSSYPVAGGQQIVTHLTFFSHSLMNVAQAIQAVVPYPSIGANLASRFHGLINGILQAFCRGIWNLSKPNPSDSRTIQLSRNYNQRLSCCSTTPFSSLFASDVRFIDFHNAPKPVPSRPDHRSAEFVQPCPRGTIAAETEDALQPQRIRPIFLTRNMPDCSEPKIQRLLRVLKDGSRCNRCLEPTGGTFVQTPTSRPRFLLSAARTLKAIGPAKLEQILAACFFSPEPLLKLQQCLGIILHKEAYYIW